MPTVTAEVLRHHPLPKHDDGGDKRERGRVLIVAGSVEIPGAALLAAHGALRAGAGVLQIATCRSVAPGIGVAMPEAMVAGLPETPIGGIHPSAAKRLVELARGCDAILIGPGMADSEAVAELTAELLSAAEGPRFLLDANAFTGMSGYPDLIRRHGGRIVVAPHAGEMAAFLGIERDAVEKDSLGSARQAAAIISGVVVMKGPTTHIVDFEGDTWVSDHGSIGLATSGSGDTLAGILAGLLARGTSPLLAAVWSVYLHAEAGRRLEGKGKLGFLARELPAIIPEIMSDFAGADSTSTNQFK